MRKHLNSFQLLFLISSLITFCFSCTPEMDKQALKEELDKAVFDQSIVADSAKYLQLSEEITRNLDTILKFRDERTFVEETDKNGKSYKKHSLNYSYDFYYNWDISGNNKLMQDVDFKNMPEHLINKMETVIFDLGKKKINGFTINRDGQIIFYLKESKNGDFTTIHHLYWDTKSKPLKNDFYSKEKVLTSNLTYRIFTDQYMGW